MAELHFDGHGDAAALPQYLNPNIFFQSDPSDSTPALPTQGTPVYILVSVKNAGLQPTDRGNIRFFVCNPSTAPTPANSDVLGASNVSLDAGETKTILCVTPWVPDWTNDGHVCVICEASASNDVIQQPSNAAWDLSDRHIAQRNVMVVHSANEQRLVLSMAATGLFNHNVARISMKPAEELQFELALRSVGLIDFSNVSTRMHGTLIEDYMHGSEPPKEKCTSLQFSDLRPNFSRGFHALVQIPHDASRRSAGMMLVEQHDSTGKLVGGVAIIVLNGKFAPIQIQIMTGPPAIPASIPHRPNGIAAGLIGAGAACLTVAAASDGKDWHERGQEATPPNKGELTVGESVKFDIDYPADVAALGKSFNTNVKWSYERTFDSGRTLRFRADDKNFANQHLLKSYRVSIDGTTSTDRHYSHYRKYPLIIGAQFHKPDGNLFTGPELYVFALLASDHGRRAGVELRDDGYGYLAGFHEQKQDAGKGKASAFISQKIPLHKMPTRLISESGVAITNSTTARRTSPTALIVEQTPRPNIGSYVGVPTFISDRYTLGPETWYIFVFAQDVNTVVEGTDSREAARSLGGILLTSNLVIGFNDHPCELNYDAAVTVV